MQNSLSKTLLVITAVVAIATSQRLRYSRNHTVHNRHTVLLGGLFPLSNNNDNQCGDLRLTAVEALEAMVFAIDKINANNTLLPNVNLTFDIRDTCSIPNKALEQSLDYVQPQTHNLKINETLAVSGVIGPGFFSQVSEAVASFYRLFQIPQISYGSSASDLSDRVRFDYFFRTLPSDAFLARAMADVVTQFNWSYIIALHSDDTFGTNGITIILDNIFKQGNGKEKCIAVQISLPSGQSDEESFDSVVARMNQKWVRNASVALLYGYRSQATGIMKAIQKLLVTEPESPLQSLTWVGCEALRVESKYHPIVKGMMRMEYRVNGSYDFQRHFTALTPETASLNPYFRTYWETKFNCSLRSEPSQSCSGNSLEAYKQKNEISSIIDAVYSFAHSIHGLIEEHCESGNLCSAILVQRSAGVAVNGTMIRDYILHNLSFPGLSADEVRFDAGGNDQSSYYVKNLQKKPDGTYEYNTVGTWDSRNRLSLTAQVEWNNRTETPESVCSRPCENGSYPERIHDKPACCWSCKECLGDNTVSTGEVCSECSVGHSPNTQRGECVMNPLIYLTWGNPWAIVILVTTCLGMLATVFVTTVYVVFHKHKIIKASSRELSGILLGGLMLCYLIPFLFLAKPSEIICGIRRFFVGLGFAVCFSALLVKTNRIHRIFNQSPEQLKTVPRFISPFSQVVITFILLSVQVVIASLWLAIEHPSVVHIFDLRVTELKCGESSDIGLVITLGYNLLLLILSTYFAFLTRTIPANFNEAKFINVTLYTIIIIWLAFIPTYFATASLGSLYQSSSLMIAIILSATTTLCCLFMPKVFVLFSHLLKGNTVTDNINATTTNGFTTTKPTVINTGVSSSKGTQA